MKNESDDLRLGRKSVTVLIEHLESKETDSRIRQLLFEHGLDSRYIGPNKLSRLGNVFHPLVNADANDSEMREAIELIETVARTALESVESSADIWGGQYQSEQAKATYDSFQHALRADGLDLIGGRVAPFISPSVDIGKEQGLLESRLHHYQFDIASNHLEQASDNAARGQWEAANGQIRSFLEALCNSVVSWIYQGDGSPPSQGQARKHLAKVGFLNTEESDLLKALFQVLHGQGSHAGTSSSDDCHRRLLMAVAMSNYFLDRLDGWGG